MLREGGRARWSVVVCEAHARETTKRRVVSAAPRGVDLRTNRFESGKGVSTRRPKVRLDANVFGNSGFTGKNRKQRRKSNDTDDRTFPEGAQEVCA